MKKSSLLDLVLLLTMSILFGFSFIASKNALEGIGVLQLVFSRYILALLLLTVILWKKRKTFVIARRDWKHFIALTMVEPVAYFIFETFGIRYTTPSSVSLIIGIIPIFAAVFAFFLLREKSGLWAVLGIFLSIGGIYLIVSVQTRSQLAPNPVLGDLLTLGAAVSAGLYTVLCRRLTRTYSPVTITYYQTMIATIVFFPLAVMDTLLRPQTVMNGFIILNIVYLSFGCSVAAYFILNFTLSRRHPNQVAIFANLIPVVTIFASWLVYDELMKPLQLLGAVFIIMGIYLAFAKKPREIPPYVT